MKRLLFSVFAIVFLIGGVGAGGCSARQARSKPLGTRSSSPQSSARVGRGQELIGTWRQSETLRAGQWVPLYQLSVPGDGRMHYVFRDDGTVLEGDGKNSHELPWSVSPARELRIGEIEVQSYKVDGNHLAFFDPVTKVETQRFMRVTDTQGPEPGQKLNDALVGDWKFVKAYDGYGQDATAWRGPLEDVSFSADGTCQGFGRVKSYWWIDGDGSLRRGLNLREGFRIDGDTLSIWRLPGGSATTGREEYRRQ